MEVLCCQDGRVSPLLELCAAQKTCFQVSVLGVKVEDLSKEEADADRKREKFDMTGVADEVFDIL